MGSAKTAWGTFSKSTATFWRLEFVKGFAGRCDGSLYEPSGAVRIERRYPYYPKKLSYSYSGHLDSTGMHGLWRRSDSKTGSWTLAPVFFIPLDSFDDNWTFTERETHFNESHRRWILPAVPKVLDPESAHLAKRIDPKLVKGSWLGYLLPKTTCEKDLKMDLVCDLNRSWDELDDSDSEDDISDEDDEEDGDEDNGDKEEKGEEEGDEEEGDEKRKEERRDEERNEEERGEVEEDPDDADPVPRVEPEVASQPADEPVAEDADLKQETEEEKLRKRYEIEEKNSREKIREEDDDVKRKVPSVPVPSFPAGDLKPKRAELFIEECALTGGCIGRQRFTLTGTLTLCKDKVLYTLEGSLQQVPAKPKEHVLCPHDYPYLEKVDLRLTPARTWRSPGSREGKGLRYRGHLDHLGMHGFVIADDGGPSSSSLEKHHWTFGFMPVTEQEAKKPARWSYFSRKKTAVV
ncbi:hypothetical protein KFL_007200060 [Klebsormidium nitens]|uniref:Uncharacterized protein n=1 Tax=Klebsormidium nitens TaxID=105231 RepID=A0A1Y1IQM2_KLENI|nr:hypothetical protein KFL_007200060 [Klebsormidium nitens]|eukprot:GAQ91056.1 hypothetical protein KFL_007200060 [Klebsormidium nitens]